MIEQAINEMDTNSTLPDLALEHFLMFSPKKTRVNCNQHLQVNQYLLNWEIQKLRQKDLEKGLKKLTKRPKQPIQQEWFICSFKVTSLRQHLAKSHDLTQQKTLSHENSPNQICEHSVHQGKKSKPSLYRVENSENFRHM